MSIVISEDASCAEKWLTCRVAKGMFSDEVAVTYPVSGKIQMSVFVPSTDVKGSPGQSGKVRVRVIRRGGRFLAILPSSHQETVCVSEQDVSDE